MKRLFFAALCAWYATAVPINVLQNIPIDAPVHAVTAINLGTFIGVIAQKNRLYKELRALLLEQIAEENEREGGEDNLSDQIRSAKKRQLVRFAFEIASMRAQLEEQVGEYELAQKLGGAEQNKREKERVARCKRLAQDAMVYEMWQPQLRTALFGTGTISALMALHRLGIFGGAK